MRILISNDDGVQAPGLKALVEVMSSLGEIFVVAPHRERSTSGHSLTLHKPLRIQRMETNFLSTSGTPADCVYVGLREILKVKPDLVLSGINAGPNLGTDIFYSGTVAAAREGTLANIPSYSFSLVQFSENPSFIPKEPYRFEVAAQFAKEVVLKTKDIRFPDRAMINVNIPNLERKDIKGICVTRQGWRSYGNTVTKRTDPFGRDYYWIGGGELGFEKLEGTDCHEVHEGYVAVTPLTIDCTHHPFLDQLTTLF